MSELSSRPQPYTIQERVTEADLKEAMMGTNGNPTYAEQYGVTATAPGDNPFGPQPSLAELELQAKIAETRAMNPMAFNEAQLQLNFGQNSPDIEALQRELAEYRHKYGQSENEKGEIRRKVIELEESFAGLMAQHQALQTVSPVQSWDAQQGSQFQPQPQYQPPHDPFENIGDDDVVQGKNVKQLANIFGSAFYGLKQQNDTAMARQANLERQLANQAKINSGITPTEEWRLMGKNPWLANLPEPNKLAAMQALKKSEAITLPQQVVQQEVANQVVAAQDRILRPLTHIEGSRPQISDNTQAALDAAYQRDLAKVMTLPIDPDSVGKGEMYRAQGLRWLSQKYNMNFAKAPSDLAR